MRAIGEVLLGLILLPLMIMWSMLPFGIAVFFVLVILDWMNWIRVF